MFQFDQIQVSCDILYSCSKMKNIHIQDFTEWGYRKIPQIQQSELIHYRKCQSQTNILENFHQNTSRVWKDLFHKFSTEEFSDKIYCNNYVFVHQVYIILIDRKIFLQISTKTLELNNFDVKVIGNIFFLRGQGGFHMADHENWFYSVF